MAKFEFHQNMGGSGAPPVVLELPVAASQALLLGDAVVLSSGQVAKAGDGTGRLLGIMAQNSASQAAGTLVEVYAARPEHVWRATASADASALVLNGGRAFDLTATTQTINIADTTGGCVQILALNGSTTAILVNFTAVVYG